MNRRGMAALVFFLGLTTAAHGRSLSFSFSTGMFIADQNAYSKIYGRGIPISLDAWYTLTDHFGLAVGLDMLRDGGTAIALSGGEEVYPLRFRRVTIPVSLFYALDFGKITLRLGAGPAFHSYEEKWTTTELVYKGKKVSPRFFAAVAYRLVPGLPRLSLVGSLAYNSIPTKAGSPLVEAANLGGFEVLIGAAFRVF
jgi:hypothetical protein